MSDAPPPVPAVPILEYRSPPEKSTSPRWWPGFFVVLWTILTLLWGISATAIQWNDFELHKVAFGKAWADNELLRRLYLINLGSGSPVGSAPDPPPVQHLPWRPAMHPMAIQMALIVLLNLPLARVAHLAFVLNPKAGRIARWWKKPLIVLPASYFAVAIVAYGLRVWELCTPELACMGLIPLSTAVLAVWMSRRLSVESSR